MRTLLGLPVALLIVTLSAHPSLGGTPPTSCASLSGVRIPAAEIGLPTGGVDVVQVSLEPPSSAADRPTPEYCKVLGAIRPIDPAAPNILFELDMPSAWNGKAILLGGGGFDGTIPNVSGPLLGLPASAGAPPLMRGYATFGSNSGHHQARNAVLDGGFALNDEALVNYAGDAVKKTHDAAVVLIRQLYGRGPSRVYVIGGSNGGREAILAAQRWPRDFDGAIAAFPFWLAGTNTLAFGTLYRAFAEPGSYPDPAKRALVMQAMMHQCDGLDGLFDGLISNVEACHFDPQTVRCPGGADAGDSCLSDAQIGALRRYASPFVFRGADDRLHRYPAFPAFSGGEIDDTRPIGLGTAAPTFPAAPGMPMWATFWDQFARYFVSRNPSFNPIDLDPEHPGRYAKRLDAAVDMLDVRPDLKAFEQRGGKLIVYQGLADQLVSPGSAKALQATLIAAMGSKRVRTFARFYTVPGLGHGSGRFVPTWDPLSVLEAWAERGQAPGQLTVFDGNTIGDRRSRPLCEQGSWPRYDGHSDPHVAYSFSCQRNLTEHP